MTSSRIAEELVTRIIKGQEVLKEFETQFLGKVFIEGKTLEDWANYLKVRTPDDPQDLLKMQKCFLEIGRKAQEAEYLLGRYELQATTSQHFSDRQFAIRYVAEMESKGKKISAEKIKQLVLVSDEIDQYMSTHQSAVIIRDFFKRMVKGLENLRKSLEYQTQIRKLQLQYLDR